MNPGTTDPVTLAVVRGALEQIADEMDLHLIHAAMSPIISETNDCAHGIFHPETGETIAQGRYGLPVFLANMQFTVQNILELANAEGGFQPGDLWILNDPYVCGTHLQDVVLVSPHFVDGRLFCIFANTGHWMDIGGGVPGGWAPKATEIHQEGMLIPPLKLYAGGQLNEQLVRMFTGNVRLPNEIAGDLKAMTNVFTNGRRGIDGLVARYGAGTLAACFDETIRRSEQQMRSYIADIPNGVYEAEDWFDNDGVTDAPMRIALKLTVEDETLHFDFTGTAPQARGPINLALTTTLSSCFVALKHIFPEVPVNGGAFRPTRFTVPEGSLIAVKYPGPVGGYLEVVGKVTDLTFRALAQAIPDRTPAPSFGTTGVITVAGRHPATERYYVGVFPYPGGYGGSHASDGLVNGTPPQSMANFMSIEMSEHRYPLRFDYFALREDSGGAGFHRGGCGTAYGFTMLADSLVTVLGDRVDHPPPGVAGGGEAAPNFVRFGTAEGDWAPELRSKLEAQPMRAGDSIRAASPGGGGFGDPLGRDVSEIERDLRLGYVSRETAERDYGAVMDGTRLDVPATEKRRKELKDGR
jgi:N-methylhydantoinase B